MKREPSWYIDTAKGLALRLLVVGLVVFLFAYDKKTELEIASEKSVGLKALNSDWTDWDYDFFGGIHVKEAKEKGLTIEKCQNMRNVSA